MLISSKSIAEMRLLSNISLSELSATAQLPGLLRFYLGESPPCSTYRILGNMTEKSEESGSMSHVMKPLIDRRLASIVRAWWCASF